MSRMQQEFDFRLTSKSSGRFLVRMEKEMLDRFDQIAASYHRSREQAVRLLIRQAIATRGAELAVQASDAPEIELMSLEDARVFLKPYFGGRMISKDTLERRIADGSIIAWKESDNRTATRWILKASLVAFMKRIGKQLESEMMP